MLICALLLLAPLFPSQVPVTGSTGSVSESQFKAMHDLKADDGKALLGKEVLIDKTRGYLSRPKTPRPGRPAVLVIHEWWGLNNHVRHWADRLALDGYAALAVDLYGGVVATTRDEAMALMKNCDPAEAVKRMQAAESFLREDKETKAGKVASLGWCFGGGMSLRLALASPTLNACALYYGQVPTAKEDLAALRAPVYAVFGSLDRSIPVSSVGQFVEGLTEAGKEHQVCLFRAEHAFANPSSPRYETGSAELAWEGLRAFLQQKLGPDAR